ncbi:uncharacterized protein SPSC_05325 [Sporisorium scitamineum]|uniref:RxLR effector protein n=1 Tax=Sporisorium scitamineum TaxID=49012 RepID=A0A0F7RTT9_9BASI|nr:hypothetical protein [Sporisorium scitamineum]CDU25432.1 uncharacterized protein SPSC_05325 [Sporisorium scitamineum]
MRFSASFIVSLTLVALSSKTLAHPARGHIRRDDGSSSDSEPEVVDPPSKPKPAWWESYSLYAGKAVPEPFNGNNIDFQKLDEFRKRLEAIDRARSHALQTARNRMTSKENILARPLHLEYWRKFKHTEESPHAFNLAGIYYQQDQSWIFEMDQVLEYLAHRA